MRPRCLSVRLSEENHAYHPNLNEASDREIGVSSSRRAMFQLQIAVALFGLAGLLGKATSAAPMMIAMGRTVFGTVAFALLFATGLLKSPAGPSRHLFKLAWPGFVLAFHWFSFFQSIQLSSVAIALLAYSSFPVFITIFEPLIFQEPRRRIDSVTAGLVLIGVAILVPTFDLNDTITAGIAWGVLSGLSFAVLNLMNRRLAAQFPPAVIAAGQVSFAALALAVLLPAYYQPLSQQDWLLLVVLGVVFTALAHYLFIQSLVVIRTQLASIVSALEPIYGGVFAWLILSEVPSLRTICGGIIILGAVVIAALMQPTAAPNVK